MKRLVSTKSMAVINLLPPERPYWLGIASLAERRQQTLRPQLPSFFLGFGPGVKDGGKAVDHQFFERRFALHRGELGALQKLFRQIDGRLHDPYIQEYGYI